MVVQEEMKIEGGVICLHCGTKRINKGEQCLLVTTSRGGSGHIAIEHKELHPFTEGFPVTPPPAPTP